jgi:hypothetical protein
MSTPKHLEARFERLKLDLESSAPCALKRHRLRACFANRTGDRRRIYRGLTTALSRAYWSEGEFTSLAFGNRAVLPRAWKGADAGLRRGTAVDAQITRLVQAGARVPKKGQFKLTQAILSALDLEGLVPFLSQLPVASGDSNVATAMDLLCHSKNTDELAVVELKCGFSGDLLAPAVGLKGGFCRMKQTLKNAPDCILNRHFAQLSCTLRMFAADANFTSIVRAHGFQTVTRAVLVYADELRSGPRARVYELPEWWKKRAGCVLKYI